MRMWMVNPIIPCKQHFLGEHFELHKFRHNFVKQHNMLGRKGQIFPSLMQARHDELVVEMLRRGMNHQSPYEQPDVSYLLGQLDTEPDIEFNLMDLSARCEVCRERILLYETNPEILQSM